jgi:adenylate cyclase
MLTSTFKNDLGSFLITGCISGIISSIFMYLFYFQGTESILAGLCIGFSVYLAIVLYRRNIETLYVRRINLLALLLINTLVQVFIIMAIAAFFVGVFYFRGHFERYLENKILISTEFVTGLLFGLFLSMTFSFVSIVSTLIGKGVLWNLFIGKYHKPREEDRIFMFLDITSSTAIAEKLGHLKYLSLLNDFFQDIAEPIEKTGGEIYKYVGDEVIITWKFPGRDRKNDCVLCFHYIEEKIRNKSSFYMKKYGLVPTFKAGMHCGIAVTGEVGYKRREIAFIGDVLNTASRIEGECNNFNRALLISGELAKLLDPADRIILREEGQVNLRGREKEVKLYSIIFEE